MFEKRISPVWVGFLLLSIVFFLGCPSTDECTDNDGDGYGNPSSLTCTYYGLDCDDADPDIHPGATEASYGDPACSDGLDNDCDGLTDDDDPGCDRHSPWRRLHRSPRHDQHLQLERRRTDNGSHHMLRYGRRRCRSVSSRRQSSSRHESWL